MSDPLQDHVLAALGQQYELESEIGRGGMSVVYRARDRRLNRTVAIKVLPPELTHDPAIRTRFTREAQTAAQLSHPNIVPIYDVGERGGIAYFVMQIVTGGNLAALLAREPRPPFEEVRRVLWEVSDALSYAHLRGVIHRDVKPDNILLDEHTGRCMVTDFGIARAIEAGTRLTVTGIAVGTPAYMSPEQAVGEREVDARSDIYSLGIVAYQMVTGRVPFTASNPMALLLKHVSERPRPIAELRPDAPKPLRDAIERAITKSPDDRWPTAAALRDALSDRAAISWRTENREPVRYATPRPDGVRATSPRRGSPAADRSGVPAPVTPRGSIIVEPEHLASLTPAQRADLRIWHGRVNLMDRIKAARGYMWATVGATIAGIGGFAFGVSEVPPFVLSPIVPMYMSMKLWRRGKSLRESGLRLRRVFLMPRARMVLPAPPAPPTDRVLEKLAPRDVLDGPFGSAIRRAVEDRAAILHMVGTMNRSDRALIPELTPVANALVERVANLARTIHRLEPSIDINLIAELDARIPLAEREGDTPDRERRLSLLKRQRATLDELIQRRDALARQLESAGLALGSLKLDLIKFRSSGLPSALSSVSNATQEARALSRDIDHLLDAAAEVRSL